MEVDEDQPCTSQQAAKREEKKGKPKEEKKKYFDKRFKDNLAKALKINCGEPENIDKIRCNKYLSQYEPERIISYTNECAAEVQKHMDKELMKDPRGKEIVELTNFMKEITKSNTKPQELPLLMKMNSAIPVDLEFSKAHNVNFQHLYKFLYSAVSGGIDFVDMNEETENVLLDTYDMMMEQVEKDAPKYLEELKEKIGTGSTAIPHPGVTLLSEIFQDNNLNPLNIPFEYLLNGKLPDLQFEEIN